MIGYGIGAVVIVLVGTGGYLLGFRTRVRASQSTKTGDALDKLLHYAFRADNVADTVEIRLSNGETNPGALNPGRDAVRDVERIFGVLAAPSTSAPTNRYRQFKANLEKLASGEVSKLAGVVRDLWRRDRDHGLLAAERQMLDKSRQLLISELALAEQTSKDEAEALLDDVLKLWGTDVRPTN